MKILAVLLLCLPAMAQKMHVQVVSHTVDGQTYTRFVPGFGWANGNANANCVGGNCNASSSGNAAYLPAHTQELTLAHIEMLLLLPDGRRVRVFCGDHPRRGAPNWIKTCKNPEVDEMEADFNGEKVKLTWGVGLDGKKKESQDYTVGKILPPLPHDAPAAPNPSPLTDHDPPKLPPAPKFVAPAHKFPPLESPVPLSSGSNPQHQ